MTLPVADDLGVDQRALLHRVVTRQDRAHRAPHVVQGNVGHESQPPLVDAHHGNPVAHKVARRRKHRAVTAHDHREVGAGPDLRITGRPCSRSDIDCRFLLDHHVAALLAQESGKGVQGLRDLPALEFADQGNMAKGRLRGRRVHCWI